MRRGVGITKWKPVGIAFIFESSVLFSICMMHGANVARGTTVSGHISVDTTWDLAGTPYIVMNDVVVDPGVTLTIDPGVEVRFDPSDPGPPPNHDYLSIFVEGNLVSKGSDDMRVEFTSDSPTPKIWDWWAIQVNSSGHVDMAFSNISYSAFGIVVSSSNNTITDSFVSKNFQGVNLFPGSSNNYVANNTAVDNTGGFVAIGRSSSNIIRNNIAYNSDWLIWGRDSFYNLVVDNRLGNSSQALGFEGISHHNTMGNNTVTQVADDGIFLSGQGYDVIENNTVTLNGTGVGIEIRGGTRYFVANNTLTGCEKGIYAPTWSTRSTFVNNNISRNGQGILAFGSQYNTFTSNDILLNSQFGFVFLSSSNNSVHHNNFIDNVVQASDDREDNSWDDGYPSGGNYWSDYAGNDFNHGPNQDILGSDGIGDDPYNISTDGTDRYPLTEPTIVGFPPRNVNAHLSGTGFENVTITWNLSWYDGVRANDVIGYDVYRSTTYDRERIGYVLVGSTPNRTTEFVDNYSGEGDPSNYFYYVCAINGTGTSSCTANQAGKFTRPLSKGPSLISIPLIQSDETVQMILQTVSYDNVWSYDSVNQEWKSFYKSKPYAQSLECLNHTMGIWVSVTQDSNLTVAGVVPTSTTINLQAGWNLVGFPSFNSIYPVGNLKTETGTTSVEGFDPLNPPYFLMSLANGDTLQIGYSYWIRMETVVSWIVHNA